MAQTLPTVPVIPLPFAQNGDKNSIPASYIGSGGTASYNAGFPPECSIPISNGGVPPSRQDMNGVLNMATFPQYYLQQGGFYTFNDSVCSAIQGYPFGAILTYYDSSTRVVRQLRSLYPNNYANFITNPEVIGYWWEDVTPVSHTGRRYFDVFYTLGKVPPAGAVELNGQWLYKTDYAGFWDAAITYRDAGKLPVATIDQYNADMTAFGECAKFVIDETPGAERIRIPSIKSFIQAATGAGTTVGNIHSAGLPGINLNLSGTFGGNNYYPPTGVFTNFTPTSQSVRGTFGDGWHMGQITFSANASASGIYGASSTVQPQSVDLLLCMQVSEGTDYMSGGSVGYITSGEAEIIATSVVSGALVSYPTSAQARAIAEDVMSSGGGGGGSGGGVWSGGIVTGAATFLNTVTASGAFIASSGAIISGGLYIGNASAATQPWVSAQIISSVFPSGGVVSGGALPAVGGFTAAGRDMVVSSEGGGTMTIQGTYPTINFYRAFEVVVRDGKEVSLDPASAFIKVNPDDGGGDTSVTIGAGNFNEYVHAGGEFILTSSNTFIGNWFADESLTSGWAYMSANASNITIAHYADRSTGDTHQYTAALVFSDGQVIVSTTVNDNGSMLVRSGNVLLDTDISGAIISGGYMKQIVAVSDTVNTSVAIPVLAGGTSYIYTQPLTSLSIASVADTTLEDRLKFTLASGGSVDIPGSCGICPSGFTFEGGKSYLVAVTGGDVIAAEYQPGV